MLWQCVACLAAEVLSSSSCFCRHGQSETLSSTDLSLALGTDADSCCSSTALPLASAAATLAYRLAR